MDNVYLLSHSVHSCILPFPPPVCLYCGCAELRFPVWYSSLSVDIHINYPDCQEPISVSFAPSAFLLPICVCVCMHTSVFVWLNIPVYTLELDQDGRRVLLCK